MLKLKPLILASSTILSMANSALANAAPSQSDFGGVGLMQMPTARMSPEGEFAFNLNYVDPYIRGAVSLTPVPWFEGVIRYTSVENRLYSPYPGYSGDQSYKDKGFDAKFRLWQESYYLPEVALGFRDIGGTGLFASEYIAASKRWGKLDFTLGMGWGYMANGSSIKNPFCAVADGACERPGREPGDQGGKLGFKDFFRGEHTGIFAGLEYQTPIEGLSLKLEYDGNDYQSEALGNQFGQSLPINIGAVYSWGDYFKFNLGYERGNTLMAGITVRTNFQNVPNQFKLDPKPEPLRKQPAQASDYNPDELVSTLSENAGLEVKQITLQEQRIKIEGEQVTYLDRSEADQRIARILHNRLPDEVSEFTIVENKASLPLYQTTLEREPFLKEAQHELAPGEQIEFAYSSAIIDDEHSKSRTISETQVQRKPYNVSLYPGLTQSLGSPETFYFYALSLHLAGEYQPTEKLKLDGILSWTILDNYDKFNYKVDQTTGAIPRSRTYIREYLTESKVGISNLQLSYFDHYGKNLYAQYYAGYLEFMYGGVGGEVLYRPFNSAWAFGVDLNRVKQRDFDRKFGFRDYEVTTGHASLYWQMPWYNIKSEVSMGQYLSGDRGITVDLSREFDNGTIAGIFFTRTNVSAKDYGEGSFNKGFYIKIPFDMMLTRSSTQYASFSWVPLTRDGGQKLSRKYSLYDMTKAKGKNSVSSHYH